MDDFGTMLGYLLELFRYKNETALTPFQEALKRLHLRLSVALPVSCHSGDGECFFGAKTVPTPFQEGLRRLTCDFVATLLLILLASFSQEGPSRRQDGPRCPKRPQEASMIRKMDLKLGQVGTKIK